MWKLLAVVLFFLGVVLLAGCSFTLSQPYAPVLGSNLGAGRAEDIGNGDMVTKSRAATDVKPEVTVPASAIPAIPVPTPEPVEPVPAPSAK